MEQDNQKESLEHLKELLGYLEENRMLNMKSLQSDPKKLEQLVKELVGVDFNKLKDLRKGQTKRTNSKQKLRQGTPVNVRNTGSNNPSEQGSTMASSTSQPT